MPLGQSCQTETASSRYSSFFWPFTLHINLLFLPPAHICFLHLHSCWKVLGISLFHTFSYQSSAGFIWSLHNCSSSVSWPFRGLPKQTASSKWNLNLNSELWAFILREIFHQEKQLYTLADGLTEGNTIRPACRCTRTWTHKHDKLNLNFRLPQLQSFKRTTSSFCIRSTPTMDNVFPWPQVQDESCGRPYNFLVCSSGKNNNCSSGWTCQGSRRSWQNPECSTEASKAAAISCPSHQSPSYDYKRGIQTKRVLLNDLRGLWNQPPWVQPPWARFSRWPKFYVLTRVPFHCQWVTILKTEVLLWKSSVVIIPLDLQRMWPKMPLSPSDGTQLSDGVLKSWHN